MPLSDDQRAMLRLLAQREQGYEDIAALMGLSVDEVRTKVKDALTQLEDEGAAPPPLAPEPVTVEPLPAPEAPEEPVRTEKVEPAAPPLEEKPGPPAPKAAARPRVSLPKSGGARAAIAAGVAVVVALIVVLAVSGGGGSGDGTTTAASSPSGTEEAASTTPTANPKLTQAVLSPVDGGNGSGLATFGRIKKNVVLQVEAKGLEPSPKGSAYTVWLYKSPKLALRIGSVTVSKSGGIAAQFPLPTELLTYVANGAFDQIDISLVQTAAYEAEIAKAKKEKRLPAYTGEDVLRGNITGPAVEAAVKKK
jgi:hypothetical protein